MGEGVGVGVGGGGGLGVDVGVGVGVGLEVGLHVMHTHQMLHADAMGWISAASCDPVHGEGTDKAS